MNQLLHMKPGKAGLQFFLFFLSNLSFPLSRQHMPEVGQKEFYTNANNYKRGQFPLTDKSEKFSSQTFNAGITTPAAIDQWIRKFSLKHSPIPIRIQASHF